MLRTVSDPKEAAVSSHLTVYLRFLTMNSHLYLLIGSGFDSIQDDEQNPTEFSLFLTSIPVHCVVRNSSFLIFVTKCLA